MFYQILVFNAVVIQGKVLEFPLWWEKGGVCRFIKTWIAAGQKRPHNLKLVKRKSMQEIRSRI